MNKNLTVVILLFTLFLTSCVGGEPPVTPELITLTLWHYYAGESQLALEEAVASFNRTLGLQEGIFIELVGMGSIRKLEELVSAAAQGSVNAPALPDLFSSYPDKAVELACLGVLSDLNEHFDSEELSLYVESFLADGRFGGQLLLIPIAKSSEILYVNADAWQDYAENRGLNEGALATWEGLLAAAEGYYFFTDALTPEVPWDGQALMGFDSLANYIISASKQQGLDVIDFTGEQAVLDRELLRGVFDIYARGYGFRYFDAQGKFRSDDIKARSLIAYAGSSSGAAYFPTWVEKDNARLPVGLLALPYPRFAGAAAIAIQQGAGMAVVKSSPERERAAALFLRWFTSGEQNLSFSLTSSYLPVQKTVYHSDDFSVALDELREGDIVSQNVAQVYEIALNQVLAGDTYAAQAFPGSYDIRLVLENTLQDAAEGLRQAVDTLKKRHESAEAILAVLDLDAHYDGWLSAIEKELTLRNIAFKVGER